jgi:hypothetical protein
MNDFNETMTIGVLDLTEKVINILEIDRYDPKNIKILEQHVEDQVEKNLYDFETNLALLKFYHFFPDISRQDIYLKIFAKALLHHEDFLSCLYLLPYTLQEEERFKCLQKLAKDLETSNFFEFWKGLDRLELFKDFKGFKVTARRQISNILCRCYQEIPLAVVASSLGFSTKEEELMQYLSENGWLLKNNVVQIPSNAENVPKLKKFEESIRLKQVAPLFQLLETQHL